MKKIAWVHPEKTFTLEMPDELYEMITIAMSYKLVKGHFENTDKKLKGARLNTVIMDEMVEQNEKS